MAASPTFYATTVYKQATVSAANTNRDGSTGTYVDLYTAPSAGGMIDRVTIKAVGVTTAGMIRFFLYDGTTTSLIHEVDVTAVASPGATTKTFMMEVPELVGRKLTNGQKIKATTHNAESFIIHVEIGEP